jgi:hypothetical protein
MNNDSDWEGEEIDAAERLPGLYIYASRLRMFSLLSSQDPTFFLLKTTPSNATDKNIFSGTDLEFSTGKVLG